MHSSILVLVTNWEMYHALRELIIENKKHKLQHSINGDFQIRVVCVVISFLFHFNTDDDNVANYFANYSRLLKGEKLLELLIPIAREVEDYIKICSSKSQVLKCLVSSLKISSNIYKVLKRLCFIQRNFLSIDF